jgi:hypothetical protein
MPRGHTRNLIRVLIGAALCTALVTAAVVPMPEELPAVAIRQSGLYRLEVALLIFYGWLLLVTPAVSGLIRGRLPVEISTRGARFAEETDRATKLNEKKVEDLEQAIEILTERLRIAGFEIKRLQETSRRDSTHPTVGSKG